MIIRSNILHTALHIRALTDVSSPYIYNSGEGKKTNCEKESILNKEKKSISDNVKKMRILR